MLFILQSSAVILQTNSIGMGSVSSTLGHGKGMDDITASGGEARNRAPLRTLAASLLTLLKAIPGLPRSLLSGMVRKNIFNLIFFFLFSPSFKLVLYKFSGSRHRSCYCQFILRPCPHKCCFR